MGEVKFTYNDNGFFGNTLTIKWWGKPVVIHVADHMEAEVMANHFLIKQVAKVNDMQKVYDEFHEAGILERKTSS